MSVTKNLLIGLPATGKTTFLAALWHVVDSAEIPGVLKLSKLEGNREYLNRLVEQWLECTPVGRTPIGAETIVSMRLRDSESGQEVEVRFPDMSGELFKQQWSDRTWSRDYDSLVTEASGALLFVHPDAIVEPAGIAQANHYIKELQSPSATPGADKQESDPAADKSAVPWSPDKAPTQVILVDLLQFMAVQRTPNKPLRLAVLVSAWDLLAREGSAPLEWCQQRLPLLTQYLEASRQFWSTRFYGVSAQGGDFEKEKEKLLRLAKPSERIQIVGEGCLPHEVTAPLKWLLD